MNPAFSWRSMSSKAVVMRCGMMQLKTLFVREWIVIPCQLLQFPKWPFLLSLIMRPSSIRLRYPLCRIYLGGYTILCRVFLFLFSASHDILHRLLSHYHCLAYECIFTTFRVIGPFYIAGSFSATSMSGSFGGSGRLKMFSPLHLFCYFHCNPWIVFCFYREA